jgi:photosystem II stability/assembly factor-like uncharacterized protein
MRKMVMILMAVTFARCASAQNSVWAVQTSGVATNLRGVSAARISPDKLVVWASGSNGVILKSDDYADHWKQLHVEGGDTLDFRGIRGFDEKIAYVMSSGTGDKSRIYKTVDGGNSWEMQYTDKRPAFFLDDIVCFTEIHCFALGDPIDGKFLILSTEDGTNWKELPRENMPAIIPSEGAFAASGSSLAVYDNVNIYFGSGGGATARVFHSVDLGKTWTVSDTPLAAGNASSGVFSVVHTEKNVVVVGGDYRNAPGTTGVAAYSDDHGRTWRLSRTQPSGYRSAVASIGPGTVVSVGPNGEDISHDLGVTWTHTDAINLNAVAVLDDQYAWAVGARGTIARFIQSSNEKPH